MSLYLGFDSSTQSIKAMIIDADAGVIVDSATVNFGKDLPEYKCPNGVLENSDPLVNHADPMVWLAALDMVLGKLQEKGAPLADIKGISGSGQQHGSVYLKSSFDGVLASLDKGQNLVDQLKPTLAYPTAPIWMDSSTGEECAELTAAIGERLRTDTGSPAIERFTGPQIRKIYKTAPEQYNDTSVIHLVSSFLASVLAGKSVAIDHGDGAGMNLLNLKTLAWDQEIADATAPGVLDKLPTCKPSSTVDGALSDYFTKYGLSAGIPVVVWSGDNPNSLIGTGAAKPGVAVISLGTSDTFFAAMEKPVVDPDGYGHVFGNPAGGFMSLVCFTNGSLAREKVKEECDADWTFFDETACEQTPIGNNGNLMLPYFSSETTPLVTKEGPRYTGSDEFCCGEASPAVKIRAILESQALTMKRHSEWMGTDFTTVRVTGGASQSKGLCQILADVFQANVEKIAVADSAALGAAMRAANGAGDYSWDDLNTKFSGATETVTPNPAAADTYAELLQAFTEFEKAFVG